MIEIVGLVCVFWAVFQLGKLWEYDHPRDGFSFTPDESWSETPIPVRRGPYDQTNES